VRLADAFGVEARNLLPVRGVLHGLELICRRVALDGETAIAASARASSTRRAPRAPRSRQTPHNVSRGAATQFWALTRRSLKPPTGTRSPGWRRSRRASWSSAP
jgi:hypothetical protein